MFSKIKLCLTNFVNSPRLLFCFYLLLNLVPSIFLACTEPFNLVGRIILILFPLGLYLVVFSLFKNNGLLQLILFPLFFLHAFQIVLFYLFGEDVIAADMFLNVATTNSSEIGELLGSLWPSIVLVCVLYLPATYIAYRQNKHKIYLPNKFAKIGVYSGLALLIISFGMSFKAINKNTYTYNLLDNVYPANAFYNLHFAINKWSRSSNYHETSKDFTFKAHRDSVPANREVYVMIIGETSRAENWSLYSYGRQTNPLLEKRKNLIHFQDAITQSNTTHKSVSIMLSTASAENYNVVYSQKGILQAFKEVGFKTVFLSNQGQNKTFTDFFAMQGDFYHNYRSVSMAGTTPNEYDDVMLKDLKHYIDSVPENLFIVMHTYGSHFKYEERYPREFAKFQPDHVSNISKGERTELINSYDNTIVYIDHYLNQVADILNESGCTSAMMYSSDHGEDILDDERDRFLHASPSPTYYQLKIPMLMWFSDKYAELHPEKVQTAENNKFKPVATNSIFPTLLNMASVKTEHLEEDLSLVSDGFKERPRMYLNDHDLPILYHRMNLKKQDFKMIEKRNMHK